MLVSTTASLSGPPETEGDCELEKALESTGPEFTFASSLVVLGVSKASLLRIFFRGGSWGLFSLTGKQSGRPDTEKLENGGNESTFGKRSKDGELSGGTIEGPSLLAHKVWWESLLRASSVVEAAETRWRAFWTIGPDGQPDSSSRLRLQRLVEFTEPSGEDDDFGWLG